MNYEAKNTANNNIKIKFFTDLNTWKEAHKLVVLIYAITKQFPKEETFGLANQMRRCAISITSNIAEGFGRKSYKEKLQFYFIALGSVTELQNQLIAAKDIGYITAEQFSETFQLSIVVHKLTNGIIKASKSIIRYS